MDSLNINAHRVVLALVLDDLRRHLLDILPRHDNMQSFVQRGWFNLSERPDDPDVAGINRHKCPERQHNEADYWCAVL